MSQSFVKKYYETFLDLLKQDAKEKLSIVHEEVVKTCLNTRFFSCYDAANPPVEPQGPIAFHDLASSDRFSPRARMRAELHKTSSSLRRGIENYFEQIKNDFIDRPLSTFELIAQRDGILQELGSCLKKLSFTQHILCQLLDSKPDYYPSPTVFRRREEYRIIEFIINISTQKLDLLKSIMRNFGQAAGIREEAGFADECHILIVNEHLNTTRFYQPKFLITASQGKTNTLFLRIPYWFTNLHLYLPVITHELAHFLITAHDLTAAPQLQATINDFIITFTGEISLDMPHKLRGDLARDIINEILIDIISASCDGFSYLVALLLSNMGRLDRYYLNDSVPAMDGIAWGIRANIVLDHLQTRVHPGDQEVLKWLASVKQIVSDYYEQRLLRYEYKPYKERVHGITQAEKRITELVRYFFADIFGMVNSCCRQVLLQERGASSFCNINLPAQTLDAAVSAIRDRLADFSIDDGVKQQLLNPAAGIVNVSNLIALLYLRSVMHNHESKPLPIGRVLRIFLDYILSEGKWETPAKPRRIWEACFIKFRLDGVKQKGSYEKKPLELERLTDLLNQVASKHPNFYYCFGPFHGLLLRPDFSPREVPESHPLDDLDEVLYFVERKIIAEYPSINGVCQEGLFGAFIEVRLKRRGLLEDFYVGVEKLLKEQKDGFKKAVLFLSLDWQDLVIFIEGSTLEFIHSIKRQLVLGMREAVQRTLTTVMVRSSDFQKVMHEKIHPQYPLLSYVRLKSGTLESARAHDEISKVSHLTHEAAFTPGIYDYSLLWKDANLSLEDIHEFYLGLSTLVSDIRTDVLFPL